MKPLAYIMTALALALSLPPSVFDSANVDPDLLSVEPLHPEPAVHTVKEMPGQEQNPGLAALEVMEQERLPAPAGKEATGQEHLPKYAGKAMTGQEYMLEYAGIAQQTNGCFDVMMGVGCRIQGQIPVWNQFAAVFATHFGITCPVGSNSLQL